MFSIDEIERQSKVHINIHNHAVRNYTEKSRWVR